MSGSLVEVVSDVLHSVLRSVCDALLLGRFVVVGDGLITSKTYNVIEEISNSFIQNKAQLNRITLLSIAVPKSRKPP